MCKLSCYGLSADAIADVLLKDTRTIATWQRGVSKKANLFHDVICFSITLTVLFIQMDEFVVFFEKTKTASCGCLLASKLTRAFG